MRMIAGVCILLSVLVAAAARTAAAQDVSVPVDTAEGPESRIPLDTLPAEPVDSGPSAGGAFLRSLIIPGWGQAEFGDYIRGGVYFAGQAANAFMLVKTLHYLDAARAIERRRVGAVRDSLMGAAANDSILAARFQVPGALDEAVAGDARVLAIRELVASREQQREDWIAWTVFWTLANAIDAYVTAQLADFPADIFAQRRPGGGLRIGARLPAGGAP